MCRMIAAVGRFSMSDLVSSVRAMAENANPAQTHELSARGASFRHDSGWGALYAADGGLVRVRGTAPCFEDPRFDALASIETELAVIHARRAKNPRTIATVNTHPFVARYLGEEWGFCHNGEVRDLTQLHWDPALEPEGSTDSEKLFLHILTALGATCAAPELPSKRPGAPSPPGTGPDGLPRAVARTLAAVRDFTCVNCFLVRRGSIVVATRRAADTEIPRYYTMWRAEGSGHGTACSVVSSEPVEAWGSGWRPLDDGAGIVLQRPQGGGPVKLIA